MINSDQKQIDTDMGVREDDSPLLKAILRGGMIVMQNDISLLTPAYHGGPIFINVSQYVKRGELKGIKDCLRDDGRLTERTLHLDDSWAGADDGRLRRVIFSKMNQAAMDNAYRTEQTIHAQPLNESPLLTSLPKSAMVASENVIDVGVQTYFEELDLLECFKYSDEDDKLVLAVKAGKSSAIIGVVLDQERRPVRPLDAALTKIRLKKSTLVARVLPRRPVAEGQPMQVRRVER